MKIQHTVQRMLMWPPLNAILKLGIKPAVHILPTPLVAKVPVVGQLTCSLPNGKFVKFEADGLDKIAATMFWFGIDGIEGATTRLFLQLLPQVKTFLDIGANTGIYALMAAVCNDDCEIYAFEPVPSVYKRLQDNIKVNQLQNVHAIHAAVTNSDGNTPLYVETGLRLPLGASIKKQDRHDMGAPIQVPAVMIDSLVRQYTINRVDLMKIDTETTEPAVLEGALQTIDRDHPLIICEVQYGQTEQAIHDLLDDRGYQYYRITEEGLVHMPQIEGDKDGVNNNCIFVPQEMLADNGIIVTLLNQHAV
ncbi:MAG: FkbM family methyltransferase [Caldilineaceae bacterium]|nr:FkbM family methyltransferase [Caldilineaceae bacterium]